MGRWAADIATDPRDSECLNLNPNLDLDRACTFALTFAF